MTRLLRKKAFKTPRNREREACAARGYRITDTCLGYGAMGRVFLAEPQLDAIERNMKLQLVAKKNQDFKVAIKIMYLDLGARQLRAQSKLFSEEVENLNILFGKKNVLQLLDVFICCKRLFLVTEYVNGGSLSKVCNSKQKKFLKEPLARYFFREVLLGVAAMHEKKIAHRDIKLENIFVSKTGEVKVGDLGFSTKALPNYENENDYPTLLKNSTFCGTPIFMAPEILRREGKYNALSVDIWSLGVMLCRMTSKYFPFDGETPEQILHQIVFKSPASCFNNKMSEECKDLIMKMLSICPSERPTVSEVLMHPWFQKPIAYPSNYSDHQNQFDENLLQRILQNKNHKEEVDYIHSYFIQRVNLLNSYRKKLLDQASLPRPIYKQFGLPIALPPSHDFESFVKPDIWRVSCISTQLSKSNASDLKVDKDLALNPNYNLMLSCCWVPNEYGSTVGMIPARRAIKQLSVLDCWCQFLDSDTIDTQSMSVLEKCIKYYNTVELKLKSNWILTKDEQSSVHFVKSRFISQSYCEPRDILVGCYQHIKKSNTNEDHCSSPSLRLLEGKQAKSDPTVNRRDADFKNFKSTLSAFTLHKQYQSLGFVRNQINNTLSSNINNCGDQPGLHISMQHLFNNDFGLEEGESHQRKSFPLIGAEPKPFEKGLVRYKTVENLHELCQSVTKTPGLVKTPTDSDIKSSTSVDKNLFDIATDLMEVAQNILELKNDLNITSVDEILTDVANAYNYTKGVEQHHWCDDLSTPGIRKNTLLGYFKKPRKKIRNFFRFFKKN